MSALIFAALDVRLDMQRCPLQLHVPDHAAMSAVLCLQHSACKGAALTAGLGPSLIGGSCTRRGFMLASANGPPLCVYPLPVVCPTDILEKGDLTLIDVMRHDVWTLAPVGTASNPRAAPASLRTEAFMTEVRLLRSALESAQHIWWHTHSDPRPTWTAWSALHLGGDHMPAKAERGSKPAYAALHLLPCRGMCPMCGVAGSFAAASTN